MRTSPARKTARGVFHLIKSPNGAFPYPEIRIRNHSDGKSYRSEGFLRSRAQDYKITSITQEEIILHLLADYKSHAQR
jgi:hypothetical protein